jgi:hypothetical protein
MRVVKRARWAVLVAVAAVAGASGVAVAGYDEGRPGDGYGGAKVRVVADGLNNPRGVTIHGRRVLVAEAGRGGEGPCLPNPEGEGEVCLGDTGAVTAVTPGGEPRRIVTGLPSLAGEDGSAALGLHNVAASRHGLLGVIGLGADPARRAELGEGGALLAHLVRLHRDGATPVADLGEFEAGEDPDGQPDTNPYGLLIDHHRHRTVVADAGGNDLVTVDRRGRVRLLTVFPDVMVPAPDSLGLPPGTEIPMQAVPTSVVRGPDGAYYVGQLTGFPFVPGAAKVWRVVPGKTPTVYAKGFTNIVDIEFDRKGRLWVLEISKNGLLTDDLTGALIRVDRGGRQTEVAPGALTAPGGLAIARDGSVYVSNNSIFPGTGQLLHIVP